MDYKEWIAFGALILGLFSFAWQLFVYNRTKRRAGKRTETKLIIFNILVDGDRDLTEDDIIQSFERVKPLSNIDKSEIRKAIYEMLSEETIRFTHSNKYKARRRPQSKKERESQSK